MAKKTKEETAITRLVSQRDLRSLMERCTSYDDRAATANGSSGKLIGEFVEKKNLHRGAFAMAKRMYRMGKVDPGKLWLMLAHFDDYRQKLAIDRMAKAQSQLLPAGIEESEVVTSLATRRKLEEEEVA